MRISRSTGYALLAVGYIARNKDKIILSQDISKQFNIPLEYLLKILQHFVADIHWPYRQIKSQCSRLSKLLMDLWSVT